MPYQYICVTLYDRTTLIKCLILDSNLSDDTFCLPSWKLWLHFDFHRILIVLTWRKFLKGVAFDQNILRFKERCLSYGPQDYLDDEQLLHNFSKSLLSTLGMSKNGTNIDEHIKEVSNFPKFQRLWLKNWACNAHLKIKIDLPINP